MTAQAEAPEPCACCGLLFTEPPLANARGRCGCWLCYVCLDRAHDDDEGHQAHRRRARPEEAR